MSQTSHIVVDHLGPGSEIARRIRWIILLRNRAAKRAVFRTSRRVA